MPVGPYLAVPSLARASRECFSSVGVLALKPNDGMNYCTVIEEEKKK